MKIEVTGFKPRNLDGLISCLTAVVSGSASSACKVGRDFTISVRKSNGGIKATCYNERPKRDRHQPEAPAHRSKAEDEAV